MTSSTRPSSQKSPSSSILAPSPRNRRRDSATSRSPRSDRGPCRSRGAWPATASGGQVAAASRPDLVFPVRRRPASIPGNGFVAEPGFSVVSPGVACQDHPRLGLPPRVHHGDAVAADVLPVPDPGLGLIGSPTLPSSRIEERSCSPRTWSPLHVAADRSRRRVEDVDLVALDDVPPTVLVRKSGVPSYMTPVVPFASGP